MASFHLLLADLLSKIQQLAAQDFPTTLLSILVTAQVTETSVHLNRVHFMRTMRPDRDPSGNLRLDR